MSATTLLSNAFLADHPEDTARILENLPVDEAALALGQCPPHVAAGVLRRMVPQHSAACLLALENGCATEIVTHLSTDVAADILRRVSPSSREVLLGAMQPASSDPLRRVLQYPDGTAGALMDPLAFCLPNDISVGEARIRVEQSAPKIRYYIYVVNREQLLVGVLNLRDFMLAKSHDSVASVMRSDVVRARAVDGLDMVLAQCQGRAYQSLPVVDDQGRFEGVLNFQTLQALREKSDRVPPAGRAVDTLLSVGELYWVGLSGLLAGSTGPREPGHEG